MPSKPTKRALQPANDQRAGGPRTGTAGGMERLSDFVAIVHRKSGLFVDVRPAREGQAETGADAFRRNARVGLREKTFADRAGASGRVAAGQMWKYEGDRLISMGGERDSLVLTAQWVETPGSGLQDEGGRWETILCNAEGSMNHMAHQHWQLCADGTIRLRANGMVLSVDHAWGEDLNGRRWPGAHPACRKHAACPHACRRAAPPGRRGARPCDCLPPRGQRECPDANWLLANARRANGAKILPRSTR